MATDFDPYAILQVERSARQDEIDQAYRRHWADYPNDPTPEARLRELQTAYRILSDPAERSAYDARLAQRSLDGLTAQPIAEAAVHEVTGRVPWGIKEVVIGIVLAIGLGLASGLPFEIIAELVAEGPVEDDSDAIGWQLIGGAGLELAFVFAVWLLAIRRYHVDWSAIGFRRPERGSWWLAFVLFAGAMLITYVFSLVLWVIDESPQTDLEREAYVNVFPAIVLVLLTLGFAPLMEETFFRGFAFPGLSRRWGLVWSAVASGALFGSLHLLNPGGIYIFFPITAIGILFALGANYARSILPAIGAHFLFNGVSIVSGLIDPPADNEPASVAPLFLHVLHAISRINL